MQTLQTQERANEILDLYGNRVLRLAFSYMKNYSDAEDVLQEVMFKWLNNRVKFESKEHEKAWLLRVTSNICKNKLKSFWYIKRKDLEENMEYLSKWNEEEIGVLTLMNQLDAKYREVIHLYYYEGYSTQEIARLLGEQESTIRSRMSRARKKLKIDLEGRNFDD